MKLGRQYLGKVVEVVWRDPKWDRVQSHDSKERSDVPKGLAALARWREYGVIDDITDGVARVIHSMGEGASRDPAQSEADEFVCTWVPEDLIESIRVFEPQAKDTGA